MKLTALPSKASSAFKTLFWVCLMALSACSETPSDSPQTDEIKSDNQDATPPPLRAPAADRLKDEGSAKSAKKENQVLQGFINEIDQYYANLQADTEALYQQVITFAKAPSESALENSSNAWEQAHNR